MKNANLKYDYQVLKQYKEWRSYTGSGKGPAMPPIVAVRIALASAIECMKQTIEGKK
jgi:hypothetical protein